MDKFAKSFSNVRSSAFATKIDMTSELDFPELEVEIETDKPQDTISKINWKNPNNLNQENKDNQENLHELQSSEKLEISEKNGWCILTSYPTTLKKQTPKTKDEIHQEYIDSLTPYEYHQLAHKTFTKILNKRHEHDMKFIEIYGYDYFHQQYIMPNRDMFDEEDDDHHCYDIASSDDEYDL